MEGYPGAPGLSGLKGDLGQQGPRGIMVGHTQHGPCPQILMCPSNCQIHLDVCIPNLYD